LRAQAARYAVGREVDTILSRALPLVERLDELSRYTAESAGGAVVAISLRDEDEDVLRTVASAPSRPTSEQRIPIGLGIDGRVAEDGRPAFLHSDDGGLGYAALPLSGPTGPLGVLSVQTTRARSLEREGRDRLLEVAAAAGRFLAQLGREERIHDRANRLSAIHETGMRLLAADDADEIASLATSSLAMILGAEHAILRFEDDASGRIAIRSCFGPGDEAQQEALFALDKQVSVEALRAVAPRLIAEVRDDPGLSVHDAACRSLLVWPLQREGRVVGTLAAYEKIEEARLRAGRFDEDDLETAGRFVAYVERALADAYDRSRAHEQRSFDADTGLPNERYLDRRMREEVARAEGQEAALALCICTIENLERIEAEGRPGQARLLVQRLAGALRRHVRGFDVVGRRTDGPFEILLPDPGPTPGDRIYALARAVADEIAKDEQLAGPVRPTLGFGYAIHPYDGTDRDALLAAASPPRIRMV
jgi:GGDEF domain-containing protein